VSPGPAAPTPLRALWRPLVDENPVALQVLGVCSALAVTRSLATALLMSAAVIAVLAGSSALISALRHWIPRQVRLILEITIIASLVTVVDQVLAAFFWDLSRELSVFVGLIVTNCILLGRAESFALAQPVHLSVLDGIGNGLGYAAVLVLVGSVRELLGRGELLGHTVLATADSGGWFQPVGLMLLPPSAFFLIGTLVWALRSARPPEKGEGP